MAEVPLTADSVYAPAFDTIAPNPTRAGYDFVGWFNIPADTGGTQYVAFSALTETSAHTLFARWQPTGGGGPGSPNRPPSGGRPPGGGPSTRPEHTAFLMGMPDGTIRPGQNMTRAEVATIFFRLICDDVRADAWSQTNPFSDVSTAQWHNNAISTMANAGLFTGFPDGTFRPNMPMARSEVAAVTARFLEMESDGDLALFHDVNGHWAGNYLNFLGSLGLLQGPGDGTAQPDAQISRAEAAAMVSRMLNRVPESSGHLLAGARTWPDNLDTNSWYFLYIQQATHTVAYAPTGNYRQIDVGETVVQLRLIRWLGILDSVDFTVLERPDSHPGHLVR